MKLNLFGYEINLKKQGEKLEVQGAKARKNTAWNSIKTALDSMEKNQTKYSEYRLQKISKVSLNTIKKNRDLIAEYRQQNQASLFE